MKKGKLQKNGKGWIIISTEFKTGSMSVQGDYQLTDDMNDKEIEFDNSGGYIKEIYYLNKLYTKLVQKQRAQTEQNNTVDQRDKRYSQNINNMKAEKYKIKCENGTWKYFDKENNKWENFKYSLNIEPLEKEQEVMFFWIESGNDIQLKYIELFGVKLEYGKYRDKNARAPYNFVPLNNKVVLCEKAQSEIFNGYINYSFFTKTLLANRASKDKFLIVNDKVIFPGSSFRGMVKNILEIVSYGKIETNIKNTCHFRITDHNPKSEIIDIPTKVFGKSDDFAGRVFFENAISVNNSSNCLESSDSDIYPKILGKPSATLTPHYLCPVGNNTDTWDNPNAQIRGYKFYWHRKTSNNSKDVHSWVMEKDDYSKLKEKQKPKPLQTVKVNEKFTGKIRFENLTKVELGALLFVLDLPIEKGKEYCHKIGYAKPLGLGSIKVTVNSVEIINLKERYKELFKENNWATGIDKEETNFEIYKDAFANYVLKQINNNTQDYIAIDLWGNDRLKELLYMMDFNNTNKTDWNKFTRYMEIERGKKLDENDKTIHKGFSEYNDRRVLPKPSEVVKEKTYSKDYL